jgi:hypothetical protein
MLAAGKIGEGDLELLTVTDDTDEIVARIVASATPSSEQEAVEDRALAEDSRNLTHDGQ